MTLPKSRVPIKRLLPRVRRFTANGEDIWVCRDSDVTNLERRLEIIASCVKTGKANGWAGTMLDTIEAELHELELLSRE